MDDERHEIWFYSRDGEKHGPVTFTDLRAKAKDASLNPRHDLVWTKGMDEWKPAGDIEGLFKRRATPEPPDVPAPAPTADPYQPPLPETVEEQMVKQSDWSGARRRSYLLATLVFPFLWAFVIAAAAGILTTQFGPEIVNFAMPGLSLLPLAVIVFFSLNRLVNLGMSRWWFLANFVPILNLWVGYRCFACPSGYAYHKKLDGAGIFLAIVYWGLWVLALVIVVAFFGALGSPDVQRQIQEIIRTSTAAKP